MSKDIKNKYTYILYGIKISSNIKLNFLPVYNSEAYYGQKRRLSLRIVQAVGGGDIDQLNVRVGQHGVIVGVDLRDAKLLCQRLAGGLLPGADRLTAERRDLCKLCRHRAGDGASAEDADIHRNASPYI